MCCFVPPSSNPSALTKENLYHQNYGSSPLVRHSYWSRTRGLKKAPLGLSLRHFVPPPCSNPAAEIRKRPDRLLPIWSFLVGAAGFEPTASSSRTKRATNCAMPRKYRSFSAAVLVGDERIELPQVESESTALPLCKSPLFNLSATPCAADKGYYTQKARACQPFFYFFCKSFPAVLLPAEMHRGSV